MADNYSFRSSVNGFNRNDVMAFVEKILEESEKQKEKINSLEQEVEKKNTEIEQLKAELNDNSGKCDTCDIAKVYEARLGAAMLDAKRFSEVLVKEANDTAFNYIFGVVISITIRSALLPTLISPQSSLPCAL